MINRWFGKLLLKLLIFTITAAMDDLKLRIFYQGQEIWLGKISYMSLTRDVMKGNKGHLEMDFNEAIMYFLDEKK